MMKGHHKQGSRRHGRGEGWGGTNEEALGEDRGDEPRVGEGLGQRRQHVRHQHLNERRRVGPRRRKDPPKRVPAREATCQALRRRALLRVRRHLVAAAARTAATAAAVAHAREREERHGEAQAAEG